MHHTVGDEQPLEHRHELFARETDLAEELGTVMALTVIVRTPAGRQAILLCQLGVVCLFAGIVLRAVDLEGHEPSFCQAGNQLVAVQ